MKATRTALAVLSFASLGACTDTATITAPEAQTRPASAAGGIGMGGGGKIAPDTTMTEGVASTDTATINVDRRGIGMGGGG